jgi:hypothetical protein
MNDQDDEINYINISPTSVKFQKAICSELPTSLIEKTGAQLNESAGDIACSPQGVFIYRKAECDVKL